MIPQPSSVAFSPGAFPVGRSTVLSAEPGLEGVAAVLRDAINCPLPPGDGGLRLVTASGLNPSEYVVSSAPDGITITGGSAAGVFYGVQTLRQLMPAVPYGRIADQPRFGWRGVLLDVARHFMPVEDVLRFIDLAAVHKLNVLHLHLTDDQGWRVEVPGWPRLTSVGARRSSTMLGSRVHGRFDGRPHDGFYTAADLRRIVAHAADRHMTVVPEVDMPGHMQAAIAAYPELGNGFAGEVRTSWGISPHVLNVSDRALDFCRDVLTHLCEVFPSPLIGIGGDECPDGEWVDNPVIAREGLPGPGSIQGWFTTRIASHLASLDRRVFGWDELLGAGAPKAAVIAAWRGLFPVAAAARAGHEVVACPDVFCYLDYRQSDDPGEPTPVGPLLSLADVYAFEPVPPGLTAAEAKRVLGGQANIWTEHMESARRVDYMAYPRLCAFAETVWSADRDYESFQDRLRDHLPRLDALGVNYRPLSGPRPGDDRPEAPGHPRTREDRLSELHEMTADLRRAGLA